MALTRREFLASAAALTAVPVLDACTGGHGGRATPRASGRAGPPAFRVRARIRSLGGRAPGNARFRFTLGRPSSAPSKDDPSASAARTVLGGRDSGWMAVGDAQIAAARRTWPNSSLVSSNPDLVVMYLFVEGVTDPTVVEGTIRLDETGSEVAWTAELFGSRVGF